MADGVNAVNVANSNVNTTKANENIKKQEHTAAEIQLFDFDGNGKIDSDRELDAYSTYKAQRDDAKLEQKFDIDGDGKIDAAEFAAYAKYKDIKKGIITKPTPKQEEVSYENITKPTPKQEEVSYENITKPTPKQEEVSYKNIAKTTPKQQEKTAWIGIIESGDVTYQPIDLTSNPEKHVFNLPENVVALFSEIKKNTSN